MFHWLAPFSAHCRAALLAFLAIMKNLHVQMDVERRALQEVEKAGKVVIHPTACKGMRECGTIDFDNSCHWSPDRRYLCLK